MLEPKIGAPDPADRGAALPFGHPPVRSPRIGVLIVNLGTPAAPTAPAVRRYLGEFLSDRRVVDYPRALWLPILHGVILNVRPAKTARNYAKIWRAESDESPLRFHTRAQAEALAATIGPAAHVDWAMRYGAPSIASKLAAMREAGVDRLFVLPLYPQYSASTTASVFDAVFDAVRALRWQPALRTLAAFHDEPAYIAALAAVARRRIAGLGWAPDRVILSFHGLPERFLTEGDPYHCHCVKTGRLLSEALGWTPDFAPLAFQSRFGREKWLGPSTEETIARVAREGARRLFVITPGFVADCIETLEEIGIGAKAQFLAAGGEKFDLCPCLNAEPEMAALLETLSRRELSGWIA